MFSILQKPQDTVNAEDLEILQNEIERRLVDVVTQKWSLETELSAISCTSPDPTTGSPAPVGTSNSSHHLTTFGSNAPSGKLRNSHRLNQPDAADSSADDLKSSLNDPSSSPNSTEDSVSSEGSLISSLTGSTIITNFPDSGSQTASHTSGNKRSHKGTSDRPSKRFRQNSSNSFSSINGYPKRPVHSKHRSKIVPSKFRNSTEESRPNKKQLHRNEAPDKLWPFVEQFCAAPTSEQLQELEEMIQSMDNDKDYFKVPTLGKKESSNKETPTKSDTTGGKNCKKLKSNEDETSLGALTQRLVSSFIEDADDSSMEISKTATDSTQMIKKKISKNRGGKSLDANNAKNLERKIRQELEEYDILDQQDDIPYTSEEDEVLRELVATQRELLSIQRQNKQSMQRLLKRAKKHLELDAEREKLREANADVIVAYQRLIQAKQRKRNPTKKEKDAAWKALKVQEAIFKECDDLYHSSLNREGV